MAYLNLDRAEFFCEQLEELHNADATPSHKKQHYRDRFAKTAIKYFRNLQENATVESDPSILLTQAPVRIAKLFRELISHQPKQDANTSRELGIDARGYVQPVQPAFTTRYE
jgi:hypothetical protein